jgi:hypothetical protein
VDVKSSATLAGDFFTPLEKLRARIPDLDGGIVYGGTETRRRAGMPAVAWNRIGDLLDVP